MRKSIGILILLLIAQQSSVFAQKGYLGKTKCVNFGISSNFSLVDFSGDADNDTKLEDNPVFLPKIELGYSIQKRRTLIDFETRYQMIPNAFQDWISTEANAIQEIVVKDTTKLRTNVFKLGVSLKSFSHVAPIGLYIRLGAGLNLVNSKLQLKKSTTGYLYDEGVWINKEEYSLKNGFATISDISFSIGKIIPLSRKLTLNFGIQSNFPLIGFKFNDVSGNLEDASYRKWLTGRILFSRNIIEGYVKIQLFH